MSQGFQPELQLGFAETLAAAGYALGGVVQNLVGSMEPILSVLLWHWRAIWLHVNVQERMSRKEGGEQCSSPRAAPAYFKLILCWPEGGGGGGGGEEGGKQNPEGEGPAEPGEASTTEGGDAMEVDGQGVALEPPQPQALVRPSPSELAAPAPPAVPSEAILVTPCNPLCPLSQPPQSPLPHRMQLLSPWALCSSAPCCCTRLVGVAVDKPQGKRWAC